MIEFDRFEELVEKVKQDGYLKDYYGEYDPIAIAENMVLYAPEEFKQNLYEYIDGNAFIDKDGLWSFGPFSDIRVDGVSLNDILGYYKKQVLFRQKYTNSWLRCFKRIDGKIRYMPARTRVIHPITALRILKDWREHGCPNENDDYSYGSKSYHWKSYFIPGGCGFSQAKSEERWKEKLQSASQERSAIYGKFHF